MPKNDSQYRASSEARLSIRSRPKSLRLVGDDRDDAKIKEWGTGRTRVETMQGMGLKPLLVPMASIDDGINAARSTLPLCVFQPRCRVGGLSALEQYRREWEDEKKAFRASARRTFRGASIT
jgi:hypothetical protein